MTTYIWKWIPEREQYEHVVTFYNDATVEGTGPIKARLTLIVSVLLEWGENPADHYEQIRDTLFSAYNNGYTLLWQDDV